MGHALAPTCSCFQSFQRVFIKVIFLGAAYPHLRCNLVSKAKHAPRHALDSNSELSRLIARVSHRCRQRQGDGIVCMHGRGRQPTNTSCGMAKAVFSCARSATLCTAPALCWSSCCKHGQLRTAVAMPHEEYVGSRPRHHAYSRVRLPGVACSDDGRLLLFACVVAVHCGGGTLLHPR